MPSQINLQITGRIQNIVFYKRGDKYYARSVPGRIRQTKATKKRATEFGRASRAGKVLRQQLLPVIPFPADNKMQTRLVSAIFKYLQSPQAEAPGSNSDLPFITGFQFTTDYTVTERWKVPLVVSRNGAGNLQLSVPSFIPSKNISAPAGTASVTCIIAAGGFDRATGTATGGYSTSLQFQYNDVEIPAEVVPLPVPMPPGSVIVTGIYLQYNMIKNGQEVPINKQAFMPAGVVNAMFVGEEEKLAML